MKSVVHTKTSGKVVALLVELSDILPTVCAVERRSLVASFGE